jgi:hypothetical protein
MEHTKRIQAPISSIRPDMVKSKPMSMMPPQKVMPAQFPPAAQPVTAKPIAKPNAKVEMCEKHKQYKVAYEPISGQQMCNQCLFEMQSVKTETVQEPQKMFTALITRDLKRKFDKEYKQYKDSLCDVAEVDPTNVKTLMVNQVTDFFANVRNQVTVVRTEIKERVKTSKALTDLEVLISQNEEYMGPNAGLDLAKEKDLFDQKLARGRYATVVKRQEYYNSVIKILKDASDHMQKTLKDANNLLARVVQCDPELNLKAGLITQQIVTDHIKIDFADQEMAEAAPNENMAVDEEMMTTHNEMSMLSQVQPA